MTMEKLQLGDIVVMLVEPSSTQQKIISRQLSEVGIVNIIPENTGAEALETIEKSQPDVVLSALYLPDMSGTDFVHKIRASEITQSMGFILISSETRFRYLDPIRQAGAIAILPKPFNTDELRTAMNNTLDFLDPTTLALDEFVPEDLDVLIVDDSLMARKHIIRILSSLGIEKFTQATDGLHAVEKLSDNYFDLVVTDYNMPNMDGQELVDYIRQNSTQASIPVLMVTSEENENRLAAVQKSGVSALCDKPFETGNVREILQNILA